MNKLFEHDDVRRQIAAAGQRRTLKDHTIMSRCQQIDEVLQKKVYEADGREIINATVGGKLEVFERKKLEDIILSRK